MKNVLIYLLSVLSLAISQPGKGQNNEPEIVQKFVYSLASDQVEIDSVIKKFIELKYISADKQPEAIENIKLVLRNLRILIKNSGGINNIKILRYDRISMIKKSKQIKLDTSNINPKDIYVVLSSEDEMLFPVLPQEDKVISFSTLRKGGDVHYLLLWN